MRLAHDGALNGYRQRIIAEETGLLDPSLLGQADELIARDAKGRTPGSLRGMCRQIVLLLDPVQAEERRKKAAKGRRVEFAPEQSGNALMTARELSVAVALGIKQSLTGWARIMRAAGIRGCSTISAPTRWRPWRWDGTRSPAAPPPPSPARTTADGAWDGVSPADQDPAEQAEDEEAAYFNPWGFGDFEYGTQAGEPPVPGSPA